MIMRRDVPPAAPQAKDMEQAAENQQRLGAALARVRRLLEQHAHAGDAGRGDVAADPADDELPPALSRLVAHFGLSAFERDVLLLCAGVELDFSFARACALAHGDAHATSATFSLALAALPDAHWTALGPQGPLRHWRLVKTAERGPLVSSPIAIDERILHFLLGVEAIDTRLSGVARQTGPPAVPLAASQAIVADQLTQLLTDGRDVPLVRLVGQRSTAIDVARQACASAGAQALLVRLVDLPQVPAERAELARLLARECVLRPALLIVDGTAGGYESIEWLTEECVSPVVLIAARGVLPGERCAVVEVRHPSLTEQQAVWERVLGDDLELAASERERMAGQFVLTPDDIAGVVQDAARAVRAGVPTAVALWRACRVRSRHGLDTLAQRIEPRAGWDDLILPEPQVGLLHDIVRQVRFRTTVYDRWDFAGKSARGLGLSALFTGESGTGKTMAAEVLARQLDLDLYRIDLSAVINKYIGETEKNLGRVFDAAADSGAVLLFDEADALFGKRSDVKDSHDRYANIELAYLLQRMEDYHGLAILTTNVKALLDAAFLRRIRFVVAFPFPDASRREEIWRRTFPAALPLGTLHFDRLARLNVSGGNIRNIALNAAFLAAEDGKPLAMPHLLHAARIECAKLDKPLIESELGGWL